MCTYIAEVGVQDAMETPQELKSEDENNVVEITEENLDRLSEQYPGLIRNPNGTYSVTPMYRTWRCHPEMQQQSPASIREELMKSSQTGGENQGRRGRNRSRYAGNQNRNRSREEDYDPIGFWPNPQKEDFCTDNGAPWVVPKRWKPRGHKRNVYVDMQTGETILEPMKIPVDKNRFALLDPAPVQAVTSSVGRSRINSRSRLYGSYDDVFNFDCDVTSAKKMNACSGYFVDPIPINGHVTCDYYGMSESFGHGDSSGISSGSGPFEGESHGGTHKLNTSKVLGKSGHCKNKFHNKYDIGYIRKVLKAPYEIIRGWGGLKEGVHYDIGKTPTLYTERRVDRHRRVEEEMKKKKKKKNGGVGEDDSLRESRQKIDSRTDDGNLQERRESREIDMRKKKRYQRSNEGSTEHPVKRSELGTSTHRTADHSSMEQSNPGLRQYEGYTPKREKMEIGRRRLFQEMLIEEEKKISGQVPAEADLEVLLVNTCKIDAVKIQTIVEDFIKNRKYVSIFCLTETKVRGHDFSPEGIKMFAKHRTRRGEKKGGGLAIGFIEEANVKVEEIEVDSNDILAIEGKILGLKFRIILCYFDCTKKVR